MTGLVLVPAPSGAGPAGPGGFTAVAPTRVLDSRSGPGPIGKIGPGSSVDVVVAGVAGVPASSVSAVAVNITATEATSGTFVTAYPAGSARPLASTLNIGPNDTRPNVGTNGDGSRVMVNQGGSVYDASMAKLGTVDGGSGAGIAIDGSGTAYSLQDGAIAICDLQRFLVTDSIYTYNGASWFPERNNHRMALSPDGGSLIALTDRGVTLARI